MEIGDEPVDVTADRIQYDKHAALIEAIGNAVVRRGEETLKADYIRVNVDSGEANAVGHVKMVSPDGDVWTGEKLTHNFRTHRGEVPGLKMTMDPFRLIRSEKAEQLDRNTFVIHDAVITTCTNAPSHLHYSVKAKKVTLVPDDYLEARHAFWYFGSVPVLYLPYFKRTFEDRGLSLSAGYATELGAFVKSSYRYSVGGGIESEPHLDYYTRRGLGLGEELEWDIGGRHSGDLFAYYIHDSYPDEGEEEDIDNNRYRLSVRHRTGLGQRDYMMGQVQYWSDEDILEDFFESEYQESAQPENYLWYSYRGNGYLGSLIARFRLNDFYTHVNRLPEASFDLFETRIGDSSFYFESRNSGGYLEKVWEEGLDNDEYSSVRFDSANKLSAVHKAFGFLNLVPRAAYRGTYYSETLEPGAAGPGSSVTSAVSKSAGARLRSVAEFGQKVSFKAFKPLGDGEMRHVAEPYADYTFRSDPTVDPEELYQFDNTDTLDKEHSLRIGMRNKIQTRQGNRPFDILDINGYTIYRFERGEDEPAARYVWFDAELRPSDRSVVEFDGRWDLEESGLENFNTQLRLAAPGNEWTASAEYRYTRDTRSLLNGVFTAWPGRDWSFETQWRYELEKSRVEEQWFYAQRNLDCMSIKSGLGIMPGYTTDTGAKKEAEWRLIFELWLTDFPGVSVSGLHSG
jgi:LPS-assembly protein